MSRLCIRAGVYSLSCKSETRFVAEGRLLVVDVSVCVDETWGAVDVDIGIDIEVRGAGEVCEVGTAELVVFLLYM